MSDIESLFLAPFPEDEVEDLFDPEAGEFDLPAGNSLFNPPFPRDGEDEGDEDEELGTPADEALGTQLTPASPGQFPEDSEDGGSDTSAEWPILSHIDPHEFMPIPHYVSWSLAGSWAERPSALNNLTIAMTTRRILLSVAPTLRRLVVDMPLRSLYPEDDRKGVRPVLRQGFEALVNLEEVVSIRDELFLTIVDEAPYNDPPIWDARWPKLRRLALYNPSLDFDDELWHALARLPDLEMVVYTRADGLTDLDDEPLNIKRVWLESVATVSGKSIDKVRRYPRPFTFVHLDAGQFRVDWSSLVPGWRELDPSNRIRTLQGVVKCVRGCMVVSPEESNDENPWLLKSDPRDLCQEKVMKLATGGTLWNVAVSNSYDVCCDPALIQ